MKKFDHLTSLNAIDPFTTSFGSPKKNVEPEKEKYHCGRKLKPGFSIKDGKLTYVPERHAMKSESEFAFDAYIPTGWSKHYYAAISCQEGQAFEPGQGLAHLARLDQTKPRLPSDSSTRLYQEGLHKSMTELSRHLAKNEINPPIVELDSLTPIADKSTVQQVDPRLVLHRSKERPKTQVYEYGAFFDPGITPKPAEVALPRLSFSEYVATLAAPESVFDFLMQGGAHHAGVVGDFNAQMEWLASTCPSMKPMLGRDVVRCGNMPSRAAVAWGVKNMTGLLNYEFGVTVPSEDAQRYRDLRVNLKTIEAWAMA